MLKVITFQDRSKTDWTEAEKAKIKEAIFYPDTDPFDEKGEIRWWTEWVCDVSKLPHDLGYTVKKSLVPSDLTEAVAGLEARPNTVINQKVNVAVPGFGLMMMTKVQVLYDQCTDNLQGYLDEGWRILAICPQPDQRRPDYIIGKPQQPEGAS